MNEGHIANARADFTLAIEFLLYLPILTRYFLRKCRVKEFLHVSSLIHVARVFIFIDGSYIDVCEKPVCIHGTEKRICFTYFIMRMRSLK
jgi:hypothetical protein